MEAAKQSSTPISEGERNSWVKNVDSLVRLFKNHKPSHNLGVILEYRLPISLYRVDLILTGQGKALVVELKMWDNLPEKKTNETDPYRQALDYKLYLENFHSKAGEIAFLAAAYLPNLDENYLDEQQKQRLRANCSTLSRDNKNDCPIFLKGQEQDFLSYITSHLGNQTGEQTREELLSGGFAVSRSVVDDINEIIIRGKEWGLLGEQRRAFDAIWASLEKAIKDRERREVFIVKGGPGTGKTVLALHLLARALKAKQKAVFSIGSKGMNQTLRAKLGRAKLENSRRAASGLIKYNLYFHDTENRGLDLLVVDEAHRIRERTKYGEKEVNALINSARIVVFLLDENQNVRSNEVGSVQLICQETQETIGKWPTIFYLNEQFRCASDDNYIAWVDYVLGFSHNKPASLNSFKMKVRLLDGSDLSKLAYYLENEMVNAQGRGKKARIVAGFCWPWNEPNEDGSLPKDVQIGSWEKPWNRKDLKGESPSKSPYYLWVTDDKHAGEVGCVYSAQGFEFDWVGVIWGKDLVWRGGKWIAQPKESHDPDIRKQRDLQKATNLLRNAYRILLTRAREEVVILCLDQSTRDFLRKNLTENCVVDLT